MGSNFPIVSTVLKLKYYAFENENLLCLVVKKLSQHYFILLVDQLVGAALHSSFYRVLDCAR